MFQIILVCGSWKFERNRWLFLVDKRGSRSIPATDRTPFTSFHRMVYEDFGLDRNIFDVQLSYMFPKKILHKLHKGTPPVIVGNSRQFQSFLIYCKEEAIRLCVEVKKKIDADFGEDFVKVHGKSRKRKFDDDYMGCNNEFYNMEEDVNRPKCSTMFVETENKNPKPTIRKGDDEDAVEKEHDSDDDYRFDCCDDSDGATSGDEDFSLLTSSDSEDEEIANLSRTKKCSTSTTKECKVIEGCAEVEDLRKSLTISVGQRYDTREELVTRLKILSVLNKFDFDVDRSTTELLIVTCWVEGCTWRVRASPVGDSEKFDVRIYVDKHTCSATERSARSRQATPDILALLYKNFINIDGGVDKSVLPKHVAQSITTVFRIKMSYWKAHRTLIEARKLARGTPENGYAMLPTYLYGIRKANPGTLTQLEVDEEDRFKCLFIAFGASIMGFPYMRKVVVVDGTFLQGKYKGTLLVATAQDGNFQIYPLAFAVVDTENDQSWEWFFRQLNRVIPDDDGLSIISDRHGSIAKAIEKVYPLAKRGICTYHLYKNIIVRFKGAEVFGLVKKAARAFKISEFQALYNEIEALNPGLHSYLDKADTKLWTRAYFPGDRYNMTTTNIAESMNKVLRDARSLPIVHLLEEVRLMMTRWFSKKRNAARELRTHISRGLEKLLEVRVDYAKHLKVQEIDEHQAQVTGKTTLHVVNLTEKKCSCRRFDLEKFPCVHAIAVAEEQKKSRISLCHPYYSKNYLCNAYSHSVMPRDFSMPVPEHVSAKLCLPPLVRQPPGRPKKSRIKSALEVALEKKKPRKPHTCSNCHQPGHNRTTCHA